MRGSEYPLAWAGGHELTIRGNASVHTAGAVLFPSSPERERSPAPRERRGPTPQVSDTTYNPFAELLKKEQK